MENFSHRFEIIYQKFCEQAEKSGGKANKAAFGKYLNASMGKLQKWEQGQVPKPDDLKLLNSLFGFSYEWLVTGEGEMSGDKSLAALSDSHTDKANLIPIVYAALDGEDLINVPLVSAKLSAGVGSLQVDGDAESYFAFSSAFLHSKGSPKSMVVMRVEGDSMSPEIRDGDMVLIDQSQAEVRLGRIFAVGFEDAIYLKRIDKEPGKILLKSVNPAYQPIQINTGSQEADSFRVIGQVLWVGRVY